MSPPRVVRASGVVPYRVDDGELQVALVHRPRYDDWSWPKGKLERGEDWAAAAARETREETGLQVRLGVPLPESRYPLRDGQTKHVRYWAGEVVGGDGRLEHEVDNVLWLSPTLAAQRLTYAHDREQLDALEALHHPRYLTTWPFLLVRHAHAISRGAWEGPDLARPLSGTGHRQVPRITGVLDAYAPVRVLSSPAVRCLDTVKPFVASRDHVELQVRKGLSEEEFEARPDKLDKVVRRVFRGAEPTAVCTHGPLLAPIMESLRRRSAVNLPSGARWTLARLVDVKLDKGEVLVCTMTGAGEKARVVAVERHRPPR